MPPRVVALVLAAALVPESTFGARLGKAKQGISEGQVAIESSAPIRVFLDCDRCDFSYMRQNVVYVSYVRDRMDAQVHVLVNVQPSGGGREWTVNFIGLEEFDGISQEVVFSTSSTDTDDEQRQEFARIFGLGMVRYVLETDLARYLEIAYNPTREAPAAREADDPWNLWVFRTGISSDISDEELRDRRSADGFLGASRTTEAWKMGFGFFQAYSEQSFDFDDGTSFKSVSRAANLNGRVVKSLGEHWGVGFGGSARESTFRNLDQAYRLAAAVEYNYFPYSQSAKRALTFSYFIGGMDLDYREITVLGETTETRVDHGVVAEFDAERPWGEAGVDLEVRSFLDDLDQNRSVLRGRLEFRVFRGLSVDVRADYSAIADQIYLPADEQLIEDILVGTRALRTDSRFSLRLGLRYTFGSIYNNIVNSRLSTRSGGFHRIF
ncbi:MAG: hypothetical protein VYE73_10525 [Acidobacteriota bacterium]|nr:hypothetical protein [Acidobacteriota bacterium]